MRHTTWLEYIAVFAGIASVLFSRKENILVYPTGIINTVLYTWFCFSWWELYAEGSLNFYYTIMSLYGWYAWTRKKEGKPMSITFNNRKDWIISISFFIISWAVLYYILKEHTNSNVPWADSFASAAAYTGMWQMTRKKVENWIWWIITNIVSIPLYFYKHAVFTSVQYVVFLILAVLGLISWIKKTKAAND
ncbi:MAG: nicotinamide mononucleotide transporter [Chitinophagaceae bacterium]|jgi:nicotinamide mononucleotide transporter|nr:nicotinamide mononucleotide transporter [Chitinophagaceae bacterium]MBK7678039.1 nicotinamide mononucleotide transporter [Chitinophagaceae bacterium]MBK8301357.1 nicotinamide mononucleotide transporter [Chitinophagaceae bacterium]MBK9466123.1 nicotinamide mononucleotide transporter [Chitinophagaceae bacterium]MBK9658315.1 nicotinamide mononucleotide transporter [Chitinophagaceae bacterium]